MSRRPAVQAGTLYRWKLLRLVILLVSALGAGCCTYPAPERYYDRATPHDTVAGFAYSVEVGRYDFAYECLTPHTKELIPYSRFKFAMRFEIKLPGLEASLLDIIRNSRLTRAEQRVGRDQVLVELWYDRSERDRDVIRLLVERHERDGPWLIDLQQSALQQDLPPAPEAAARTPRQASSQDLRQASRKFR